MAYVFAVEGLSSLENIDNLPEEILLKARQAINAAADRARTQAAKDIRSELNFPARYLTDRLSVRERAKGTSLQAVISGRDRPTSLARFATSTNIQASRKKGFVQVKVGKSTKRMSGGFLIKLRNDNIGLAMRLKPGETVKGKRAAAKRFSSKDADLVLLYGPSIDQAFQTEVDKTKLTDDTARFLENEFIRLMGI